MASIVLAFFPLGFVDGSDKLFLLLKMVEYVHGIELIFDGFDLLLFLDELLLKLSFANALLAKFFLDKAIPIGCRAPTTFVLQFNALYHSAY